MIVIRFDPDPESLMLPSNPAELTIDPKTWADKFKLPEFKLPEQIK